MEFVVERASNGTLHSSCPSAAFTPTRFCCENTINLPRAADLRDDRRAVAGAVAGPCPLHRAGRRIERRQRAVVVAADVQNHHAAIDERRHRGVKVRLHRRARLLPQLFARVAASNAVTMPRHAQREQPAAGESRRRFRTRTVTASCCCSSGTAPHSGVSQIDLAGGGIDRAHHFVLALARELIDAVADENGR